MKPQSIGFAVLCLALVGSPLAAQQTPQGQTPPGTDMGAQRPNPSAIPEKFGPSIDAKKPIPPEEQTGQGNTGTQTPHSRGLDLQPALPDAKTMSEPPARPPQSQ
jgi:hypothetical protein